MANPNQQFEVVQLRRPARSLQDGLSHDLKFTCDIGPLYPVGWWETLPGDYFKCTTKAFLRLQPLALPIFHDIEVYFHYFYTPEYMYNHNREKFRVPQDNEGDSEGQTPVPLPLHTYTRDLYDLNFLAVGELLDFLGIPPIQTHVYASSPDEDPTGGGRTEWYEDDDELVGIHGKPLEELENHADPTQRVCLYPMFCYQLIYDCYYKPEKFVESLDFDALADMSGAIYQDYNDNDISSLCTLRNRGWEKDLFTSALPTPQQGLPAGVYSDLNDLAVNIFLRDAAEVDSNNVPQWPILNVPSDPDAEKTWKIPARTVQVTDGLFLARDSIGTPSENWITYNGSQGDKLFFDPAGSLVGRADQSARIGFTIEEWRFAFGEQRFREDLARTGDRITEVIRSQFGVVADDLTLNRPRYLGGGKQMIVVSEVLQQSASEEGDSNRDKLGSFAGHGYSIGAENKFRTRVNDFGIIMCIMSIRPRSSYGQGMPRYFSKFNRYDFFWPHLSHLGEQPVRNDELFMKYSDSVAPNEGEGATGFHGVGNPDNDGELGYQPIYHDYRYVPSRLAGHMRTDLQDMHLNRLFSDVPRLNKDFIEMNPRDFDHVFAVGRPAAGQHILGEVVHNVVAIRNVPKYGNPAI